MRKARIAPEYVTALAASLEFLCDPLLDLRKFLSISDD
jgi:hypothetical protein